MRYAPEWVDKRGRSWIAPNENQKKSLERLVEGFNASEVEIIDAGFGLEATGKVPKRICEVADIWLRKAAKVDACAIKALSFPNKSEKTRIEKLVRMAGVI